MAARVHKLFNSCLRIRSDFGPLSERLLPATSLDVWQNIGDLPLDVLVCLVNQFTRKQDAVCMRLICRAWRRIFDGTVFRVAIHTSCSRPLKLPPSFPNLQHMCIDHGSSLTLQNLKPLLYSCTTLVTLQLSASGVTSLPSAVCGLPRLQSLVVTNCSLTALPPRLHMLPHLRLLDVSSNQLHEVPALVGSIPTLTKLDLSNNMITYLPESIGACQHLVHLNVSYNQLTELPDGLAELTVLTNLCFNYNRVETLPVHFTNLTSLLVLACFGAFSHPPSNEDDKVVGALAHLDVWSSPDFKLVTDDVTAALVRRRARRLRRALADVAALEEGPA